MAKIAIQSIPYDANSSFLRGASQGPKSILKAFHSPSSNYCTQDGTDLSQLRHYWEELRELEIEHLAAPNAHESIFEKTHQLLAAGKRVISLGGDHSITFPIIRAYAEYYSDFHLLQIDAHGDLYHDFEGNYYSHASPFARILEHDLVSSLTQIGNRTLNPHQRQQIKKFNVSCVEMKQFNLQDLPILKGPLYVSFDLDALDPAFAPGVSHYEPGGLSTFEALKILEHINVEIIGADIVELNPFRDINEMTAMVGGKLLKEFLTKMIGKLIE